MEIERNLAKKLPACISVYEKYLPRLNLEIIPLPAKAEIKKYIGVTAAKDVPVLVSALRGKADFLVTGDKKDFAPLTKWKKPPAVTIVNHADFLVRVPGFLKGN
jgi:predicted nucleic acid-binding protein